MELVPVCAWCPPVEIPVGKEPTHTICKRHLIERFPDQAAEVLAMQQVNSEIELANSFLAPQTF